MRNGGFLWVLGFFVVLSALIALTVFAPLPGVIGILALIGFATTPRGDPGMLTPRGRGLLLTAAILSVVGVSLASAVTVALLGLTLLLWFGLHWLRFAARAQFGLRRLVAERRVSQGGRPVSTGWASLPLRVSVRLMNSSRWNCPIIMIRDVHSRTVPNEAIHDLPASGECVCVYELTPLQPGVIQFAGVLVQLRDDCGFFRSERILPAASSFTILPCRGNEGGRQTTNKRLNSLPPPGLHRLRRPGTGSELLELRDYRPGDPPKMIAWKPSARRDRLITKEFESEVPVRCVLFLDCSDRVRIGTEDNSPIARLASTAAGILVAAQANRDLVGAAFFTGTGQRMIAPARTATHVLRLLDEFSNAAALLPELPETNAESLIAQVEPVLRARMPSRFDRFANSRPFSMFWRPLLDTRWGYLVFIPIFVITPLLVREMGWLEFAARIGRRVTPGSRQFFVDFPVFLLAFIITLFLPSVLAMLFWLAYGSRGFLSSNRDRVTKRKQIATIFVAEDNDTPAAVERYLVDDNAFAIRCGRFLSEERIRIPVRQFDEHGRDRFRDETKVAHAAKALLRATSRAKDNELYVILADLIDCDNVDRLLQAVKVARAEHHMVLLILYWPADVPLERTPNGENHSFDRTIRQLINDGVHRRYEKLRREFTRAGATVLRFTERDTVATVMNLLDRLRGARSRR